MKISKILSVLSVSVISIHLATGCLDGLADLPGAGLVADFLQLDVPGEFQCDAGGFQKFEEAILGDDGTGNSDQGSIESKFRWFHSDEKGEYEDGDFGKFHDYLKNLNDTMGAKCASYNNGAYKGVFEYCMFDGSTSKTAATVFAGGSLDRSYLIPYESIEPSIVLPGIPGTSTEENGIAEATFNVKGPLQKFKIESYARKVVTLDDNKNVTDHILDSFPFKYKNQFTDSNGNEAQRVIGCFLRAISDVDNNRDNGPNGCRRYRKYANDFYGLEPTAEDCPNGTGGNGGNVLVPFVSFDATTAVAPEGTSITITGHLSDPVTGEPTSFTHPLWVYLDWNFRYDADLLPPNPVQATSNDFSFQGSALYFPANSSTGSIILNSKADPTYGNLADNVDEVLTLTFVQTPYKVVAAPTNNLMVITIPANDND